MDHKKLVEQARAAINAVFSNRSVGPETTIEALEELSDFIEASIEALRDDLKRREGE